MTVDEVHALFDTLIDEDDVTFVTQAQRVVILEQAYDRFRRIVSTLDPHYYGTSVTITPAADTYNLSTAAVKILGVVDASLTATRLSSLVKVYAVDSSSNWAYDMIAAASWEELRLRANTYLLVGSVLHFHAQPSDNLVLQYVPINAISWTDAATFIDDLAEFHDIIALLAADLYSVRDGIPNQVLSVMLTERRIELEIYLNTSRVRGQSDHIARSRRR